jgi:molybdopterin/thiamine biosynthesis adenylyltransferase
VTTAIDIEKATSRPLAVARSLVKHAADEASIYAKIVVLTGQQEVLQTANGRWCFLDALFLLSRIVGNLTVVLPRANKQLEFEVEKFCAKAWSRGPLQIVRDRGFISMENASAILSVGTQPESSAPTTVINSNGWVARVSSGKSSLPHDTGDPNALGALFAASMGASEIFKRVFDVPHEVAPLLEKTEFSLFDYTAAPAWNGPPLPAELRMPDTLLVGAGAIGNGIALLFSQLPVRGQVHIIDKQNYADENLGTCILLERKDWIEQPKASRLATWLHENSYLEVTGEKALIESVKSGVRTDLAIDVVLNGLDNINARRATQDLWPSIIIDGAINEVGAAVVQHRLDQKSHACLKCWFDSPPVDETVLLRKLTGLNISSQTDRGRFLTEQDIAQAPADKREFLRERRKDKKNLCSILSEAVLASKLGVDVQEGFSPSAPFVATAASAMVMAEAIKALVFPDTEVTSMVQIASLFLDPKESTTRLRKLPLASCQCVVHREKIEQMSAKRKNRNR